MDRWWVLGFEGMEERPVDLEWWMGTRRRGEERRGEGGMGWNEREAKTRKARKVEKETRDAASFCF